jgi:hypothetical protein
MIHFLNLLRLIVRNKNSYFSNYFIFAGGLGSYLLGMSSTVAKGFDDKRTAPDVKELSLGWMIAYLFLISFLGLFSVLPLRKVFSHQLSSRQNQKILIY